MKNATKLIIFGVILAIAGIVFMAIGFTPPAELKDAEGLAYTEMSSKYSYYIEDLELIDSYAELRDAKSGNGKYYIGCIEDANGNLATFSVYFDNDSTWKQAAKDCNFYTDTLEMTACFQTQKTSGMHEDIEEFYNDAVEALNTIYLEYGVSFKDSGLHLKYVCDDKENYEDEASQMYMAIVGAVVIVLGGVLFYFGTKARKKEKEAEARAREQAATFYNPEAAVPNYPTSEQTNNQGPEF